MPTGCSGFIGLHASQIQLERGDSVIGVDHFNDCDALRFKLMRLAWRSSQPNYKYLVRFAALGRKGAT